MLFNSLTFVVFFAIILVLHNMPFSWRARKMNLLIASYLFYAAWNPPLIILLWISTLVDWFCGKGLARAESQPARRAMLAISLVANLGMLGFSSTATSSSRTLSTWSARWALSTNPRRWIFFFPSAFRSTRSRR